MGLTRLKVPLGRRAGWFCVLHVGSWLNLKVVLHKRAPMTIPGIDLPPLTAARVDGSDCAWISDVAYAHQPASAIWTLLIWWSQGSVSLIIIAYFRVHCGCNFSKTRDCWHPVRRLRWFCFRLGLCGNVSILGWILHTHYSSSGWGLGGDVSVQVTRCWGVGAVQACVKVLPGNQPNLIPPIIVIFETSTYSFMLSAFLFPQFPNVEHVRGWLMGMLCSFGSFTRVESRGVIIQLGFVGSAACR